MGDAEIEMQVEEAFGDIALVRFVPPALPMPEDCAFQIAPDGELVVRVYKDGRVEFGDVMVDEAARQFWAFITAIASGGTDETTGD